MCCRSSAVDLACGELADKGLDGASQSGAALFQWGSPRKTSHFPRVA
ncbi:MAG: hypothetical protein IT454_08005 [Planctomycetes bacterium]|nr:hypothetical protein [Planctomycetota bacterium]